MSCVASSLANDEYRPHSIKTPGVFLRGLAVAGLIALIYSQSAFAADKPSLDLQKYAGKVAYIDFWASWCVPCRQSFPWMWLMTQRYVSKGFVVVTVNLDKDEKLARQFLADFPEVDLPVVMDPTAALAKEWKVAAMPTSFLLDRKGKIRYLHRGFLTGETQNYEAHIIELTSE